MKLVASLITRNELGRYLTECVGSLLEFCDEIRVHDDASDDGTYEWLADRDDRVVVQRYDEPTFYVNEGRTRQMLFDWTLKAGPSHILAIDSDEFVSDGQALRTVCAAPNRPVWSLTMEEIWGVRDGQLEVRFDGGWRPHPVPILYAAPARSDGRHWRINPKALACGREPLAVRRTRARNSGVSVLHFGWACQADRQARYDRYVVADGGRYHANSHLESIMWPDEKVMVSTRPWPPFLDPRRPALTERIMREGS